MLEEKTIDQLGMLVLDEMHMIGDAHRGYIMELLVTKVLAIQLPIQVPHWKMMAVNGRSLGCRLLWRTFNFLRGGYGDIITTVTFDLYRYVSSSFQRYVFCIPHWQVEQGHDNWERNYTTTFRNTTSENVGSPTQLGCITHSRNTARRELSPHILSNSSPHSRY